jgi:hypothetical protein
MGRFAFAYWPLRGRQTGGNFNIFSKKSQQKLATKKHKKHKEINHE